MLQLGKKIKEMRKIRNYSARQLSEHSGIARSLISQLETGKRQSTSMDTIYRLAKALDVPVSYFLAEESDESTPALYNQAHSSSHFVISEDTLPYMSTLQKAQEAGITPELLNEFIDLIVRARGN